MAKAPIRFTLPKVKPMAKVAPKAAPKPAPKPAAKPTPYASVTDADLARHARMQGEEARSEGMLLRRRPSKDVISVVTRERTTPTKKGR